MNDQRQENRYRRGRRRRGHRYSQWRSRRSRGWGLGLYRNRREGKIFGVAAGLADYWDVADWMVRLVFIGAFLFTGMLAIWAYIAGAILLSPRPEGERGGRGEAPEFAQGAVDEDPYAPEMEYDEERHNYRPRRMFRYSDSADVRLARGRQRLNDALQRVASMERYVTSRRFKLNSEISRL
jgi:phage shock protein C